MTYPGQRARQPTGPDSHRTKYDCVGRGPGPACIIPVRVRSVAEAGKGPILSRSPKEAAPVSTHEFPDHWMFIPGPVNVDPAIRTAMSAPPINHRGADFAALFDSLRPKIQWLMKTKNAVHLSTSSAVGIMEVAARNLIARKSLHLVCGAFSELWYTIVLSCGQEADALAVAWGRANRPEELKRALDTGAYDTVCVVQSETSTSVMNPIPEIAEVLHGYPEVVFCLDAVSALAASPVLVDDWGVDLCFASVQKGLALPPGFTVFSVSEKALGRARAVPNRGYYFDLLVFEQYAQKSQTPTTPSLPHMYGLNAQLDRIKDEGLENRWERHRTMAAMTQRWATENFACFAEEPYRSAAVTAVTNTRGIDVPALNRHLAHSRMVIAGGYGKLKGETFRIGHVGETRPEQLQTLLEEIDRFVAAPC